MKNQENDLETIVYEDIDEAKDWLESVSMK